MLMTKARRQGTLVLIPEARRHQKRRYLRTGIIASVCGFGAAALVLGASVLLDGSAGRGSAPERQGLLTRTGIVTGIGYACAGPLSEHVAHLRVYPGTAATARADAYLTPAPVARMQLPNATRYRFVLSPGRYFITNSSTQMAVAFVLRAGGTVRLNVLNMCT